MSTICATKTSPPHNLPKREKESLLCLGGDEKEGGGEANPLNRIEGHQQLIS